MKEDLYLMIFFFVSAQEGFLLSENIVGFHDRMDELRTEVKT